MSSTSTVPTVLSTQPTPPLTPPVAQCLPPLPNRNINSNQNPSGFQYPLVFGNSPNALPNILPNQFSPNHMPFPNQFQSPQMSIPNHIPIYPGPQSPVTSLPNLTQSLTIKLSDTNYLLWINQLLNLIMGYGLES